MPASSWESFKLVILFIIIIIVVVVVVVLNYIDMVLSHMQSLYVPAW